MLHKEKVSYLPFIAPMLVIWVMVNPVIVLLTHLVSFNGQFFSSGSIEQQSPNLLGKEEIYLRDFANIACSSLAEVFLL